jgi:lysozyme family protein
MWQWIKNLFKKKQTEPVPEKPVEPSTVIFGSKEWLAKEYDRCSVNKERLRETTNAIVKIIEHKLEYMAVQTKTGVPWWVVACIHYRESSLNFKTCLHNGDPLGTVTVHVPKGRGPFHNWEDAAVDALIFDGADKNKDWSIGGSLDFMEKYNGLGYRRKRVHSCYLFSCTGVIRPYGRYTSDGIYNPIAVTDDYLGVACIMKGLGIK